MADERSGPALKPGGGIFVFLLLVAAVAFTFLVSRGPAFDHAHRLAAAGTAPLNVLALAALILVVLLVYQSAVAAGTAVDANHKTLGYRRRRLKTAVTGQDGRASPVKAQGVLGAGAVVSALVDLLLARTFPGGDPLACTVTSNWRPENLMLSCSAYP